MTSVNLRDFPEELHYRIKIQAAVEKISIKALVIKALNLYLERYEKRRE